MIAINYMRGPNIEGRATDARDPTCPCRPCWTPDDYGGRDDNGNWHTSMECHGPDGFGCPSPIPDAVHVFVIGKHTPIPPGSTFACHRCGQIFPASTIEMRKKIILPEEELGERES